jgi:DNA-binding transcriptional LysR family regulator
MHAVNIRALDMNLLIVLEALLRERHVGRAAIAVGRSQPAVSHALARLRLVFADPLLVQSGRRMVLTPRAEDLIEPLDRIFRGVDSLFEKSAFDPGASRRVFRIMAPDVVADRVAPPLMAAIAREAPGVRIDLVPWRGVRTLTRAFLDELDLIASAWTDRFPGFASEPLLADHDVVALRTGHPAAVGLANVPEFLALPHVAVVGPGETEDMVDAWLRAQGHVRNIALCVPSYLLALRIVAATDRRPAAAGRRFSWPGRYSGARAIW